MPPTGNEMTKASAVHLQSHEFTMKDFFIHNAALPAAL